MKISEELLAILACPACKGAVDMTEEGDGLACPACGVVYPVREGIPVMLAEEAVDSDRWAKGERTA